MKKMKQIEACDFCNEHECYEKCLGCGKSICWECRDKKKLAVKYNHGVYCSGSGDGTYCNECDVKFKDDPLHRAYVRVQEVRKEADETGIRMRYIVDKAESDLKALQASN